MGFWKWRRFWQGFLCIFKYMCQSHVNSLSYYSAQFIRWSLEQRGYFIEFLSVNSFLWPHSRKKCIYIISFVQIMDMVYFFGKRAEKIFYNNYFLLQKLHFSISPGLQISIGYFFEIELYGICTYPFAPFLSIYHRVNLFLGTPQDVHFTMDSCQANDNFTRYGIWKNM